MYGEEGDDEFDVVASNNGYSISFLDVEVARKPCSGEMGTFGNITVGMSLAFGYDERF